MKGKLISLFNTVTLKCIPFHTINEIYLLLGVTLSCQRKGFSFFNCKMNGVEWKTTQDPSSSKMQWLDVVRAFETERS